MIKLKTLQIKEVIPKHTQILILMKSSKCSSVKEDKVLAWEEAKMSLLPLVEFQEVLLVLIQVEEDLEECLLGLLSFLIVERAIQIRITVILSLKLNLPKSDCMVMRLLH